MRTISRWGFAATAGLLVAFALPARGQESALARIPAKAAIVVQMNGLDKARERLGKMLGNAVPDVAPAANAALDKLIKSAFEGRDLKAVAKDRRAFLVVTDLKSLADDNPAVGLLVPVTSYAAFRDSFLREKERKALKKDEDGFESATVGEQDIFLVDLKDYALATPNKDVARSYLKKFKPLSLGKETGEAFLNSDLAALVNVRQINDAYGDQIRQFKMLFDLLLTQAAANANTDAEKKQLEAAKVVLKGLLQVLEDGVALVVGVEFRPEGFNLRLLAQIGAKTETNSVLKPLKPSALTDLGKLPSGQMIYTGENIDPDAFKALSALSEQSSAGEDDNEEVKKAIADALKELHDSGPEAQYGSASFPATGLEVHYYKDPKKAVAAQLKLMKALTKSSVFEGTPLKAKPVVKEGAETVGDFKFHSVRMQFDIDKATAELPEGAKEATKALLQKMLGEELHVWFGTDGKVVLQATAKEWKEAKALIESYTAGTHTIGKDEAFALTRKQLPADSSILMLADTGRFLYVMLDLVGEFAQAVPGFPGQFPKFKPVEGKPAYFGVAIGLRSEYATADIFVPTTAVQQVRRLLAPVLEKGD